MFLEFRTEVEDALVSALETFGFPTADLGIEEPPEGIDAVLASSAAFRLTERVGDTPPSVAEDLAAEINAGDYRYLDAVVVQGPYVNFLPSNRYYDDTLTAAQASQYGQLDDRDETVVVEHTSANPTGPIHVGRARNPILGDAIVRVLDLAGYDVAAHYYVNDAGRQIAVFTWAYETFDEVDLPDPSRDRIEYDLVRYYRKGSEYLESADPDEVEQAEAEIRSIMRGLEEGNESVYERVSTVVDQVLGGMQACLERLPAEFDEFVKETRFLRNGDTRRVIERLQALDAAAVTDDAWQLDLGEFGIEKEFVFLRSDGTSLYATRDIAHHEWKLSQADRAVTVLGEDHKLQADQLMAALELLGNDAGRVDQVFYSWVNLPEGGMSTREGTGVALDDLLDEAIDRARDEVETRLDSRIRDDELGEADIARIARQVGIGAVRFDIVSKQPTKGITFKWEDALDFEAQSAPYVQYVHARCCGILEGGTVPSSSSAEVLTAPEEKALLDEIARFPAVVDAAAIELEPHLIATFTRDFAESFNAFYRECPVLQAEGDLREGRLALVNAARHTVGNALWALGVEAPDSM